MPLFDDREKVAEREYEQERELAFKVRARRNRLFGMWAAGHMGLVGAAAERYARTVVDREIVGHDDESVIAKVRRDLIAAGSPIAAEELRTKLESIGAAVLAQRWRPTGMSPTRETRIGSCA